MFFFVTIFNSNNLLMEHCSQNFQLWILLIRNNVNLNEAQFKRLHSYTELNWIQNHISKLKLCFQIPASKYEWFCLLFFSKKQYSKVVLNRKSSLTLPFWFFSFLWRRSHLEVLLSVFFFTKFISALVLVLKDIVCISDRHLSVSSDVSFRLSLLINTMLFFYSKKFTVNPGYRLTSLNCGFRNLVAYFGHFIDPIKREIILLFDTVWVEVDRITLMCRQILNSNEISVHFINKFDSEYNINPTAWNKCSIWIAWFRYQSRI